MREIEKILQLWEQTTQSGEAAILATVVKTQGSSYRLPGARLLLTHDGQRAGSVSGGCLESELLKKAWWLTEDGPIVRRYDTTAEGEIGTGGFGLGCNGIIHVLVERVLPASKGILDALARVRSTRRAVAVCHVIGPAPFVGRRLIAGADGVVSHDIGDSAVASAIEVEAFAALLTQTASIASVAGLEVFIETLVPPVRLLVFGAGDDAIPLTEIGGYLGWRTCVYDGRAHYARRGRFPAADEVVVHPAGGTGPPLPVDAWTVAVLMTHSYSQDLDILREIAAAARPLRYIGILGPRKRSAQLLADAGLDSAQLGEALHSPMGLDIGADGPEQVAIAVVAEIQAVLHQRQGGQLRQRHGSIHAAEENEEGVLEEFRGGSVACA
jgi:xanthine dehydrogenase accessory factor